MTEKKTKNGKPKQVGNGEGSLYLSTTLNRWIFQYTEPSGKRQTLRQKKNESERAFRKRVTHIKSQLDNGSYIEKCTDTFIDILKKYVDQKHKDGIVSDRSYSRELETIKQVEKTCSNFINKPIQNIKVEDIENSKENMREYSNSVIEKIWIAINKTFKIAYARRKISFNIMLDETLKKPVSKKVQKKVEALTIEEEKKLVSIMNNEERNHKYRNIILMQLWIGARIGEILALDKKYSINLKNETITIWRTLTQDTNYRVIMGDHTKTFEKISGIDKGKRTFPMNAKVKKLILEIYNKKLDNIYNLLFWDYNKNTYITPSEINSYLKRINKKYNITKESIHTHRLRHTFITRCVESGMNLKVLQTLVGHVDGSSITSDVYTSVSNEFMIEELKKIN